MSAYYFAQRSQFRSEMLPYVDECDPIEAALACKLCIDRHAGALSGPPPPLHPKRPPREQADGWTDPEPGSGT